MPDFDCIAEAWKKRKIDSVYALDAALSNYRVLFAYHSNKIENAGLNLYQTREIFENGRVISYTGDLRALFETGNQKECYDFLREYIVNKTQVTPEFICQVHGILMHGCYNESRWQQGERPGEYKKHYYLCDAPKGALPAQSTSRSDLSCALLHGVGEDAGVAPEEAASAIQDLCMELQEAEEKADSLENILNIAGYFHLSFENIHPFADGNGRVGRTLINYILLVHGMPPVIIFDEDRETYYMALAVFDKSGKIDGFVRFIKEECVKTWTKESPVRSRNKGKMLCL